MENVMKSKSVAKACAGMLFIALKVLQQNIKVNVDRYESF